MLAISTIIMAHVTLNKLAKIYRENVQNTKLEN